MANTPQDDRFYKGDTLLKWFAISSICMFVFTLWMVLDDFGREWKGYQREFFAIQQKKYDAWIQDAKGKVDENKLKELEAEVKKADEALATKKSDISRIEKELVTLRTRDKNMTSRFQTEKAIYDVRKYEYEAAYGHKKAEEALEESEAEAAKAAQSAKAGEGKPEGEAKAHAETPPEKPEAPLSPKAKAAYEKLEKLWDKVVALKNTANEATQAVEDKQKELDAIYAERTKIEKDLKKTRLDLDLLIAGKKGSELTLQKVLRSAPIIDMANPTFRLQQIVLPTIRDDVYFAQVQKVDRCTTCHLAIDKAGYEDQPNPYKTHPRLDLMLGSRSPHPIDKIGCTVCHEGRGSASHFVRAAHTPRNEEQKKEWEKKYGWNEGAIHHVIEKMIPLQYTEGKCRVCHRQTEYVGGAEKLNASTQLIKAAGCYGCHRIEGWDHLRKPAPSLKRVKGKLTREWIYKWIRNPRSFNDHARMPAPFLQSNITTEEHKQFQIAEMHAIVDFLLNESEDYRPGLRAVGGDANRGKELFGSVGCLACHQINDFPRTRGRYAQAPDLSTVGSKASSDWLFQWVKNPKHYWQDTTMPSFRLSDQEAGDLVAFLASHKNPEFDGAKPDETSLDMQKRVLRLYLERDPKLAPVTREKVDKVLGDLKPHEVTMQLGKNAVMRYGCFGCHEIKGMEKTPGIGTELSEEGSKPVNKLDFGLLHLEHTNVAWFHEKLRNTRIFDSGQVKEYLDLLRMPNFGFSDEERNSIVLALEGMTSQKVTPPASKEMLSRDTLMEEGLRVVHKYNCQGCHVVEGLFASLPENHPQRDEHEKLKYNLEGRILKYYEEDESVGPPPLVTEGKRVQTDWVHAFVKDPGSVKLRARLKIRMPTFQMPNEELNKLVTYWAAHGQVEFPIVENRPVRFDPQQLQNAKALFTKLQCLNCHTAGEKLTAAEMEGGSRGLAPDLLHAHKRLRREWIVALLKDPQKMIPGTRMPGFWPEGNSPAPEILNGDSEAQINLLADYVLYLGQSRAGGGAKVGAGEAAPSDNRTAAGPAGTKKMP